MRDIIVFFLCSSLLVLVVSVIWKIVHYYSPRLSRIDDELHGVTVMQKEFAQQLRKITSLLEESSKTGLTRADIEDSSQVINDSLEKVLWQMRFDEDKYAESIARTGNGTVKSGNAKVNNIYRQRKNDQKVSDDTKSMKAILKNDDDDYDSIVKYMLQTGKSGINALHVLDEVRD
jgi:hypothetical protein